MCSCLLPSVPVCPHAGGVGLCELVQHLILFDYICVSGSLTNRYEPVHFFFDKSQSVLFIVFLHFILGCVNMSITSMSTLPVLWWFVTPITWPPRWDQFMQRYNFLEHLHLLLCILFSGYWIFLWDAWIISAVSPLPSGRRMEGKLKQWEVNMDNISIFQTWWHLVVGLEKYKV